MVFDEPNLVANAGLLLVATLVARLDLEALINATVRLIGRVGGSSPGAKVLTLVNTMISGGSHIDHTDVLRSGGTAQVVGHRVYAPSTVGSFLRAFSFGHVRQLEHSPRVLNPQHHIVPDLELRRRRAFGIQAHPERRFRLARAARSPDPARGRSQPSCSLGPVGIGIGRRIYRRRGSIAVNARPVRMPAGSAR